MFSRLIQDHVCTPFGRVCVRCVHVRAHYVRVCTHIAYGSLVLVLRLLPHVCTLWVLYCPQGTNASETSTNAIPGGLNIPLRNLINSPGQFMVCFRNDIACIVGVQGKTDGIVYVGPIGMMLLCFSYKCHFCHKSKCLGEVFKLELGLELIVFFLPHNGCDVRFKDVKFKM